nr:receptor-like protein 12 [Ipomoea batatas]
MHALGHCLPDQKSVLIQIRSEITYNSSASTKLVLWDEGGDCCRWPGLSCNAATGYITSLDLSDEGSIMGGFNVSLLYKLPSLSVIRLDWVKFSAPFPDFFTDFTNLTVLSLSYCNFSGTVPHKVFQLSGHITELRNVTSPLESLDLSDNNLEGTIPSFFFRLQNLTSLYLSSNKFFGQMIDLQNVTSPLESLDLRDNNLEGTIPSFFFRLQSLASLHLSSNKFFDQMIDLQNVTSPLESLDLRDNNLEGTIPSFFFQLQILTSLDLSSNKFFGQMIDLQNVTSPLQSLDLSSNDFEGTIPPFLFQLQNLTILDLSSNKFNDLSNNTINGEIPNWIWGIGNGQLFGLKLSHNSLTHMKEPMEYGSLNYLDLNSNMLSGQIPRPPPEAMYLDFSNNNFSMIPLDFADQIPYFFVFFSIAKNRLLECGEWLVGPSRQGVGLSDIVDGQSFVTPTEQVVPRVGSTFVCLAPRKANRPARTVLGSVRPSGVHSIASVPSLDLLDDVNFFKWELKCGSDDLHEFLFSYSGQTVSRDDICSLAAGAKLNTTVLFEKIYKLKLARFSEALGSDFALGSYKTLGHVHLRLEIIDNSASTQPTPVKYGDTPENVKLLFSEYFTFVGEKFKSIVCDNLKTKRMPMKWRDTKNKVDYGMYLMRHMESYVGEAVKVLQNGIVG